MCINIFAFSIEVDYGVENNKKFSIITLKYANKFICKDSFDINNNNILVECIIQKSPISTFPPAKTEFFEIYSQIRDNKFHLFIKPLQKQSLFSTFLDLKKNIPIPKERPKDSKIWQIIGYFDEIPFLSNKIYSGINFPINIPNTALPVIKELNIDASPLIYNEGPDFGLFLSIRLAYNNKNYNETIKLSGEMLRNYNDSIFRRDSLLYRIRAMYKSYDVQSDDTLQIAKEWVRFYPADTSAPEVLYIIADSYGKLRIFNEARYYFDRIINEYEDSKYVQYALVGIANNLAINGDKRQAKSLFMQAYESAKDIDTASFVAYEWGMHELNSKNLNDVNDLFLRIIKGYPSYFLKDVTKSYNDFHAIANVKLYNIAARAGDSMLNHLPNDEFKEKLMMDISLWYELDSKNEDAHRINMEFLRLFGDSTYADTIKKRDDSLLFSLNEGNLEKQIQQYDYLIETYPNSENSKIAYEKKANVLFTLGKYKDVISLKKHLPNDNIDINNSYIKLIESSKNCKEISDYYVEANVTLITNNSKEVFDCLFQNSLLKAAKSLSSAMLKDTSSGIEKLNWLYNEAKISQKIGDFNNATIASRDAFLLAKEYKIKEDVGIILFSSLAGLNRKSEAMAVFNDLLKIMPNAKNMLVVYDRLLRWALDSKDNIALELYAKEIINLQNKFKNYEYSPFVELSYADFLFNDNRYTQMLEVLKNIFSHNLNSDEIQKVRYMQGSAYYELGNNNNAKIEFDKCIEKDAQTSFGKLCSEALNLLEN